MSDRLDSMSGKDLARLFSLDASQITWTDADRASVLQHQLAAPLLEELREVKSDAAIPDGSDLVTFGDLLFSEKPPIHLLRLAKQLMKDRASKSRDLFPKEVAGVLYVASICAALVKCEENISENEPRHLLPRVEWGLKLPWIDDRTRSLLTGGLGAIKGDR